MPHIVKTIDRYAKPSIVINQGRRGIAAWRTIMTSAMKSAHNKRADPAMPTETDILFTTVNEQETKALIAAFGKITRQKPMTFRKNNRVFQWLGQLNGHECVLTITEMGSGGLGATHQAVNDSIAALNPGCVISIGIAFGVNQKKQKIGDILVSKQILLYELQKKAATHTIMRGDRASASPLLLQVFRNAVQSWNGAAVRFGLLLTGEKLVDNVDYRNELIAFENEAIGGEMEGAGLYTPCQTHKKDWIVVKAICDWADGKKSSRKASRQQTAAENAAEFVVHSLQQISIKDTNAERAGKKTQKTKIIVDFAKVDAALARWLSDRLQLAGYDIWNRVTAPMLGETLDEIYSRLIAEETSHVIVLLSRESLNSEDYKERRMLAFVSGVKIIPVQVDDFDDRKIEKGLRDVERTNFSDGWGPGYDRLLKAMVAGNVISDQQSAVSSYAFGESVIVQRPETLVSNQYRVLQIPATLKKFKIKNELAPSERSALLQDWPAAAYDDQSFISFLEPSAALRKEFGLSTSKPLANNADSFAVGLTHRNALIELLKKSFYFHCKSQGMAFCSANNYVYFPQNHPKLRVRTIGGKSSTTTPAGERVYKKKDTFQYQIAVVADILANSSGHWLLVKVRVRLTNTNGVLLKPTMAIARRKYLCKNWWNDEWLKRTMAVMQFVSKDGDFISIGGPSGDAIKINAMPDSFESPVSLDETQLSHYNEEDRDEILADKISSIDSDWDGDNDDDSE